MTGIKDINVKHKNKVNVVLQNLMHALLRDSNATLAKISLGVMTELNRRNTYINAKWSELS